MFENRRVVMAMLEPIRVAPLCHQAERLGAELNIFEGAGDAFEHVAKHGAEVVVLVCEPQRAGGLIRWSRHVAPNATILVMCRRIDARGYKRLLGQGALEVLSAPFGAEDFGAELQRALAAHGTFVGALHGLDWKQLLQVLGTNPRGITIDIVGVGRIDARGGVLIHAQAGTMVGAEALEAIRVHEGGRFEARPLAERSPRSLDLPIWALTGQKPPTPARSRRFTPPLAPPCPTAPVRQLRARPHAAPPPATGRPPFESGVGLGAIFMAGVIAAGLLIWLPRPAELPASAAVDALTSTKPVVMQMGPWDYEANSLPEPAVQEPLRFSPPGPNTAPSPTFVSNPTPTAPQPVDEPALAPPPAEPPQPAVAVALAAKAELQLTPAQARKAQRQKATVHRRRGERNLRRGRLKAAKRAFAKSVQLRWANPTAHAGLARVAFETKHFSRAAHHYQTASRLAPKRSTYLVGLGQARYRQGKLRAAGKAWKRARRLAPKGPAKRFLKLLDRRRASL